MSVDPTTNGDLEASTLPAAGPVRVLEPRRSLLPAIPLPAPLVVAASGFLAGVVALTTLRAMRTRRRLRRGGRRGAKEVVTRRSVVAKRSFLVDVHMLGK